MKTLVPSAAALALGSVLCVPSLAMAQPTLNVADTAALVAGGTGAIVSITITCPTQTNNVRLEVDLLQLAGTSAVTGHGGVGSIGSDINCNPQPLKLPYKLIPYDSSQARLQLTRA